MKKLTRTVYPVGMGGFLSERFVRDDATSEFCMIYDCGSDTHGMNTRINSIITNELTRVDVLFISHFHRDHINQVTKLPITKETKVFIPWLYNPYILLKEYLYNMEYTSLVNWLRQNATVIFIDPFQIGGNRSLSPIEEYDPEKEDFILPIVNLSDGQHVDPLFRISIPEYDWCYIPFHLQDNTVFDVFITEALKAGIAKEKLENFDVKDRSLVRKLSRLYKKVCKQCYGTDNLNYSTMLLVSKRLNSFSYSNCQENVCFWRYCPNPYRYDDRLFESYRSPSCLFTGDTLLNIDSFRIAFKSLVPKIMNSEVGLLQLPHHGSKNGYIPDIWQITKARHAFVHCVENPGLHQPVLCPQIYFDSSRIGTFVYPVSENKDTLFEEIIVL
ncbi:MAG: MBL fold metallo-hydrolase [Lachnospiraceae bacterium]|nr:MBL fold metallo-hydrolase [Lachnospiraceae bacterium]